MRIPFSLIFLFLVLAEIAVFIYVGEAIGVLATLGLTLFGMIAGAILLRAQGMATLMRVRAEIEAGRTPARPLGEGAVLAVAALLIILPGFLTDLMGILLFLPPVRELLWRAVRSRVQVVTAPAPGAKSSRGPVIDLDHSEYGADPRPDSPWRSDSGPQA
jgi:UPF0716 protein FxsA